MRAPNTLTCYRAAFVSGHVGWYAVGSFDELLDRLEADSQEHGFALTVLATDTALYLDATTREGAAT
jgi:hypothetical protein